MNAHQRRIVRRQEAAELAAIEGRADRAEAALAEMTRIRDGLRADVDSMWELAGDRARKISQLEVQLAEMTRLAELERDVAARRGAELADACLALAERQLYVQEIERELAIMRAEDRDASKLRRRLAERGAELDRAHGRVRQLEEQLRAVERAQPIVFAGGGRR